MLSYNTTEQVLPGKGQKELPKLNNHLCNSLRDFYTFDMYNAPLNLIFQMIYWDCEEYFTSGRQAGSK